MKRENVDQLVHVEVESILGKREWEEGKLIKRIRWKEGKTGRKDEEGSERKIEGS